MIILKFCKSNIFRNNLQLILFTVTNEGTTEHQDAFLEKTSTFINPNQIFSAPNDHLLSKFTYIMHGIV